MVSLMNGLSAAGAGIASFAGTAGLEQQKAMLANQSAVLADQLATTRETGLQQSGGVIAAAAAQKAQDAAAANIGTEQAGANTRNTQTIAGTAANTAAEQAGATGRTAMTEQGLAARTQMTVNAMTPEEREVRAYTGGAVPGTPAYQKGVAALLLLKAGISPDLYGASPTSAEPTATAPSAAAGVSSGTGATGAGALPSAAAAGSGTGPATPAVTGAAYTPKAPGLDNGAPPGGYNEAILSGKPAWLVAKVHALNEGREEPPSSRSLTEAKSPEFVATALLQQYNPNFDATLYPVRLEAQKAIAKRVIIRERFMRFILHFL